MFAAAPAEEGGLALLAVEHLVDLVGTHRLVPVGIPLVGGSLVEALVGGVAVEEGAPEGGAFDRVAVAAAGAVAAGEHELELAGAGFAEDSHRGATLEAVDPAVPLDLVVDLLGVLLAVEPHEDLLDHGLLVLGERFHLGLGDLPVVVDLEAQLVIEGEADDLPLLVVQAVVEGFHEGLRRGLLLLGTDRGNNASAGDGGRSPRRGAQEGTAVVQGRGTAGAVRTGFWIHDVDWFDSD